MNTTPPIIGIDFGTSSSKMAWYDPKTKQADIIMNAEGELETPSVVYFGKDETLVGSPALDKLEYEQERDRVIISIKRELVTTPMLAVPEKSVKPVEVAAEILRKLKRDAENLHFHQEVTRAVTTYPASFGPLEQDKIREATRLAGFTEVEMLEEPVAAAMAYAQMGLQVGKYVLVYDLGGGTFDLAVLTCEDDLFRLALEPQGIKRCGGDDFDEALYNHCNQIARQKLGRPISLTSKRDLHFLQQCRQRKENLSVAQRRLFKSYLEPEAVLFQYEIDRATFENLISHTIEETVRKTKALLEQANAEGQAVDTIVLIGGSSRVPLVHRLLEQSLHPLKPLQWQKQDVAVALGAAYHANKKWNTSDFGSSRRASEQYRSAVEEAWAGKKLDEAKLDRLTALAKELELTKAQVDQIEREVMGDVKDKIFEQQVVRIQAQYRSAVEEAWVAKKLDKAKIGRLTARAKELALSKKEVTKIEREVMGGTKETIFEHQRQDQYRKAVTEAWIDRKLDTMKVGRLTALTQELELSKAQVAKIEREVMGDVKEEVLSRQVKPVTPTITPPPPERVKPPAPPPVSKPENFTLTRTLTGHTSDINAVVFSPDGQTLISASSDTYIKFWQVNTGELLRTVVGAGGSVVWSLAFSADGQLFASGGRDKKVQVWDPRTGAKLHTLSGHTHNVHSVAFGPDKQTLASCSADKTIKLWNARTGTLLRTLTGHSDWVTSIAFTSDGQILASGSTDRTIKLWNPSTGALLRTLTGHSDWVTSVAFSLYGQNLVSGGADNAARLWNPQTGASLRTFSGHSGWVNSVVISPNGQLLITGSDDKTVKFWNLQTASPLGTLTGHSEEVLAVAISPSGQTIASASKDKAIKLWKKT